MCVCMWMYVGVCIHHVLIINVLIRCYIELYSNTAKYYAYKTSRYY